MDMDTTNSSVADNGDLINGNAVNCDAGNGTVADGDADKGTVVNGDVDNGTMVNGNLAGGNVGQPPCLLDATLAVKVALHIRPLIEAEQAQGCKDCIIVVPGHPQVQIGHRSFTFDNVYGSTGSPSSAIFEECVAPLVEGLFHGYNATVLAYGQTGSGKTYTMGTAFVERSSGESIIPHVMETIFKKMETQKERVEFQLRVSFIEILNEEVHDLLDMALSMHGKHETSNGFGSKACTPTKPSIQIRETPNGEIFLAGVTEIHVNSLEEMASCLEQGSHSRTTASTNMNTHSSRSHAIFSIALDQKQKWDASQNSQSSFANDIGDDFLCAKLHLVDLAGSERAKRTGTEGIRFKEGIHINKGLLALGNVISALGDEKKRKEGGHVPYRDSKLTRLLQDSLGGNSRTVMIACVSPADSNAEETINTLKYANRARNIQNRPIVNRDPMVVELQRLRQQLELVQSELLCLQTGEGSTAETEMMKKRIAWLEESNKDLQCELEDLRNRLHHYVQLAMEAEVEREKISCKLALSDRGEKRDENDDYNECIEVGGLLQSCLVKVKELDDEKQWMQENGSENFGLSVHYSIPTAVDDGDGDGSRISSDQADTLSRMLPRNGGEESNERENELASKELEHSLFQECLDRQLQELNRKLQQKEEEMKAFLKLDSLALKQYFEKKLVELEEEKAALQREKDALMVEYESLVSASDERNQKMHDTYLQKSKILESQILDLKKKQENQAQLIKEKQQSEEAARRLQEEIQRIKTQKVQLQQKMKQESEQFRQWKDSREKELFQLRKEWRRNEHEMLKLQALNQRQKMVLQRKTEEAALATRRLKELLEARKSSARSNLPASANSNGPAIQKNDKDVQRWVDNELQVAVHIHEARCNYEKQANSRSAVALELAKLKQEERQFKTFMNEEEGIQSFEHSAASLAASHTRLARIRLLEAMLNASSSVLVSMASELSEAEERERCFGRLTRSQDLRTMADAKRLLKYVFNEAIYARCQLWDKEMENKEFKEKVAELTEILKQSESLRKEMERQKYIREDAITKALCTSTKIGATTSLNFDVARDTSGSRSQLRYLLRSQQSQSDGYSDSSSETSGNFESQKDLETGSIFDGSSKDTQSSKPWKWKRSNRRWLLPFKWKWQKPWRLSQLIRHGDDTITRPRQSKGTGALLESK